MIYSLFLDSGSSNLSFLSSQDWSVSADTSSGGATGFAFSLFNSSSDCVPEEGFSCGSDFCSSSESLVSSSPLLSDFLELFSSSVSSSSEGTETSSTSCSKSSSKYHNPCKSLNS